MPKTKSVVDKLLDLEDSIAAEVLDPGTTERARPALQLIRDHIAELKVAAAYHGRLDEAQARARATNDSQKNLHAEAEAKNAERRKQRGH